MNWKGVIMEYTKSCLPITDICLNVTEECNLACRYCFTEHHPNYMTIDVAKDTVKWLLENAKIASEIKKETITPNVGFFGGEPTLMWDSIIVPLVEWVKENQWPVNFGITSNCVLMDKEKVDFLINNNIGLLLSMDGNELTQNYNRPYKKDKEIKSFDLVSKNLPYIAEKMPNTTFRSTITQNTAQYLFDNLMFAGNQGFINVFAIINEFEDWTEENRLIVEREINKYALYVIDACMKELPFVKLRPFEQAINKIVAINSTVALNPDIDFSHIGPAEFDRCGLGNGYGSVNYKGDIFACQEVASRKGEKNIFYIGNIYTGIDEEKLKNLQNQFFNRPIKNYNKQFPEKCKNCASKLVCNANFCHVNNYILYKDFGAIPDCWCWWNNLLLEKAQFVMQVLSYHKNEFFKNYFINEINSPGGPI